MCCYIGAMLQVHNISDILGGFLVAIIFTTPFAIKAIGLHSCIKRLIDDMPQNGDSKPDVTNGGNGAFPAQAAVAPVSNTGVHPLHTVQVNNGPTGVGHRGDKRGLQQPVGPGEQLAVDMPPAGVVHR